MDIHIQIEELRREIKALASMKEIRQAKRQLNIMLRELARVLLLNLNRVLRRAN